MNTMWNMDSQKVIRKIIKNRRTKKTKEKFNLGDMPLEMTENYKYLGYIQNSKNNNEDHLKSIKGKTEAANQK